jgi:hypothetical protein
MTIYQAGIGAGLHIHVDVNVGGARQVHTDRVSRRRRGRYASGVRARDKSTNNANDNVFSDGTSTELAALTGSVAGGYTASLTIGISV